MSGQALGWVFEDSPMKGATFLVHLALADVANDLHDHELWCSTTSIAKKTRLTRFQVGRSIHSLCDEGLLVLLEERPGRTNRYRFVLPAPVTESHRSAHDVGNEPVTDVEGGVTPAHTTRDSESHERNRTQADNPLRVRVDLEDFEWVDEPRFQPAVSPEEKAAAAEKLASVMADRFGRRKDLA